MLSRIEILYSIYRWEVRPHGWTVGCRRTIRANSGNIVSYWHHAVELPSLEEARASLPTGLNRRREPQMAENEPSFIELWS